MNSIFIIIMFYRRVACKTLKYARIITKKQNELILSVNFSVPHRSYCSDNNSNKNVKNALMLRSFEEIEDKSKSTYLEMIQLFINRDHVHRRGHVEFIYSALRNMESFGVQKDLEVYKALINVLPKGKFIPTNFIQAEFMHYPKQQNCIIDLLEQMEDNAVMPDYEMEDILVNIFGRHGYPLRKFWRMMYWMPKFKNLSPWPVPNPPPGDILELAKLAIERISSVDLQAQITIYQSRDIVDSIDDTWIVSSQSITQKQLLEEHSKEVPIYVEGPFYVWLKNKSVNYFVLRANPTKIYDLVPEDTDDVSNIQVPLINAVPPKKEIQKLPTVHEQEDGTIFSLCATGTSSKDSLLSWIRHLEKENPCLSDCSIVFTLRTAEKSVMIVNNK